SQQGLWRTSVEGGFRAAAPMPCSQSPALAATVQDSSSTAGIDPSSRFAICRSDSPSLPSALLSRDEPIDSGIAQGLFDRRIKLSASFAVGIERQSSANNSPCFCEAPIVVKLGGTLVQAL